MTKEELTKKVAKAKELLGKEDITEQEQELVHEVTMMLARYQSSPSKINAVSILKHKDNSPETIANYLFNKE